LHKSARKNISALKAQLKNGFIARIQFQVEVWQNHYLAKLFFYNHFAVQSFCQKKTTLGMRMFSVWECARNEQDLPFGLPLSEPLRFR